MNATNDYGCINMGVNFTCYSAKANPQVHNYMLFRNDSEVSFSEKGTWTERISRGETFVYKCVAYQQIDNVTSRNNVTLAVGGKFFFTWIIETNSGYFENQLDSNLLVDNYSPKAKQELLNNRLDEVKDHTRNLSLLFNNIQGA